MTDDTPPPGDEPTIGGTRYTLEDLGDYLDRGREPRIDEIETDAECRAVLDNLERLGSLSRELVDADAASAPPLDEAWLGRLLGTIGRELKAGRDIPLASPQPGVDLAITEGAVRELIRAAGDAVDGVIVGSSSLVGDLATPDAPVRVRLAVSVRPSRPIRERTDAAREAVAAALAAHTELTIEAVDVTVTDLHGIGEGEVRA